jgi:hypothetical protein
LRTRTFSEDLELSTPHLALRKEIAVRLRGRLPKRRVSELGDLVHQVRLSVSRVVLLLFQKSERLWKAEIGGAHDRTPLLAMAWLRCGRHSASLAGERCGMSWLS